MTDRTERIGISEFKAKALKLIDLTYRKGKEYIITKKGVPVAKVVPIEENRSTVCGSMKGKIQIKGDIVNFDSSELWDVLKK